jgi:hypothetical protein
VFSLWLLLCLLVSSAAVFGQHTPNPAIMPRRLSHADGNVDKEDYAPGEVAIIIGKGWTLDQYVDVHFEEEPAYDHHHEYHDTKVNADGTWEIRYRIEESTWVLNSRSCGRYAEWG